LLIEKLPHLSHAVNVIAKTENNDQIQGESENP
jgi:hypothetical protein